MKKMHQTVAMAGRKKKGYMRRKKGKQISENVFFLVEEKLTPATFFRRTPTRPAHF